MANTIWQGELENALGAYGEETFLSGFIEDYRGITLEDFEDSQRADILYESNNNTHGNNMTLGLYLDNPTYDTKPILMTAILESADGIYPGIKLTTSSKKLKLQRIAAKVSVVSQDNNFVLEDMYLYDVPYYGNFFRTSSTIPYHTAPYGNVWSQAFIGDFMDEGAEMALYPYEASASNTPYLFLKANYNGEDYVYVLDFTATDGTPLDMLRNHHYKFVIKKGAKGMEPPYNFEDTYMQGKIDELSELPYDIEVTDTYGYTVTSTGEYYLSMSNEEFIVMAEDDVDLFHIHAATVTTDLSQSDDPTPNHMHLNSKSVAITSDTGEMGGESLFLPTNPGEGPLSTNIYIDIPANVKVGRVTITLGDIKKEITVKRVAPYEYSGSGYLLGTDILHAEIDIIDLEQGDNDWLKGFSINSGGTAEPVLSRSSAGPVYMMTKNWRGIRDAGIYYTREGGGRTKVMASMNPDFDIQGPNSYLVTPGGTLDIPVEKAFGIWADEMIMGLDSPLPFGEESLEVVWQDTPTPNLISPYFLESDEIYESVIKVNIHPSAEGNALLAYKVDGEILWSWHIWVTGDASTIETGAGTGNKWMDRNLGALINTFDPARVADISGMYYQGGRKEPFPGISTLTGTSAQMRTPKTFYNSQGVPISSPQIIDNAQMDIAGAIKNPYLFINAGASNPTISFYDPISQLRDQSYIWRDPYTSIFTNPTEKSIFDPCPEGWRIPIYGEFGGTSDDWVTATNGRYNEAYGGYYFCYGGSSNASIGAYSVAGSTSSAYYYNSNATYTTNLGSASSPAKTTGHRRMYIHSDPAYAGTFGDLELDSSLIKFNEAYIRCTRAD